MAPQSYPQAQFVPIPPDLDLGALVESTPNWDYVTRVPAEMLKEQSIQSLEQLILLHVVIGGKPMVLEGWEGLIDPYMFSPQWLETRMGQEHMKVRDIPNSKDEEWSMGHYLKSMGALAKQFTPYNYNDPRRQRIYMKDIDCPDEWAIALKNMIPETFYYLNDCVESRTGGDGAMLEANEYGQMRYGKGAAPAGDLMSSLPPEMRAMNMMCYIGHEGTYTPAHREMCASLGHNIMVETSTNSHGEKEGSSIWFMTETKEREVVSEYFLSMLGHDIEVEKHFAQINAWKKAPFNVWVVEQKVGDFILIPPLAPHQVWNRGTRTMKAAWNRTTVDTLELALHESLPRARMVCREEQYKNKAIIYYTLLKYHDLLQRDTIEPKMWRYGRIKQLLEDFKRLFTLYTEILVSEMFITPHLVKDVEFLPYDSNVTCSYCRCNIFNRFLTCKSCIEYGPNGEEDTYDVCMDCYAMGRSCSCISNLSWVEQWAWSTLIQNYEDWRQLIVRCEGTFDVQKSPQPLEIARKRYGRKPVAQVCQEQLKIRPFKDPKKPDVVEDQPGDSDNEIDVDDNGHIKAKSKYAKRGKGRIKAVKDKTHACHICSHQEWNWKLAFCTTCESAYCYGTLWRGFDLLPSWVMEDRDWSCPKCQGICSCSSCKKKTHFTPYTPKGTLLGHDTKKVADFRSVESLVDFAKANLHWLRDEIADAPQETTRMKRLREKADAEKAREDVIDESYLDDDQPYDHDDDRLNMELLDPDLHDATGAVAYAQHNNGYGNDPMYSDNLEHASESWANGHDHDRNSDFQDAAGTSTIDPSVLAALIAPMIGSDGTSITIPAGQNRMMGAGYYQQRTGSDQILYIPPNTDEEVNKTPALPASTSAKYALSDLLPPPEEEKTKRRRHGSEDDTEFFASKRQKQRAEIKSSPKINDTDSHEGANSKSQKARAPRRSVGHPKTYTDLDEDALPFREEDVIIPAFPRKPRDRNKDDNVALAAQAMNLLTDGASDTPEPKRTSSVRRQTIRSASPITRASSAASNPKRPRKSAWLARKEEEEPSEGFPAELPPRTRKARKAAPESTGLVRAIVDISSGSDEHDDDTEDIEEHDAEFVVATPDTDTSFKAGLDNTGSQVVDSSFNKGDMSTNVDSATPNCNSTIEDKEKSSGQKPPSKRRGRPPKNAARLSLEKTVMPNDSEAETAKPEPKRRGRPPRKSFEAGSPEAPSEPSREPMKLLSLKEKMALKGRSVKIVAAKKRAAPASSVASPSIVRNSPLPATASPTVQQAPSARSASHELSVLNAIKENISRDPSIPSASPREEINPGPSIGGNAPAASRPNGGSRISASLHPGPTVVRLDSPSEKSYAGSVNSDDDSSSVGSIPAFN